MDDGSQPDGDGAAASWIRRNLNYLVLVMALIIIVFPRVSPFEGLNHYLTLPRQFSEWLLDKVESLFKDWGYYVVFFGVLLENSMFLGLLVPGSIILILGGLAAENGSINVWLVIGLAIIATIIGDTISYFIGRMGWAKALEKTAAASTIDRFRGAMEANSGWIILGYHWAGYSRAVGPAAAGLFRIPYRRWAFFDYIGGALWAIGYTLIGVILGVAGLEFGDTESMVRLIEIMFLALFVIAIVAAWYRTQKQVDGGDGPGSGERSRTAPVIVHADDE